MNLRQLVGVTNEVIGLERPSPAELQHALHVACVEFGQLCDDDAFFAMGANRTRDAGVRRDVQAVFDNLGDFETFLRVEDSTMREAGLNDAVVAGLLAQIRRLRAELRVEDQRVGFRNHFLRLRDTTCRAVRSLDDAVVSFEEHRFGVGLIRRVAYGIGGATTMAVNAGATVSIGPILAAASVVVGEKLIEKAFD